MFEKELNDYGYNTYWKVLHAKNYGIPQNRERVYLIIIKKDIDNGLFKFPEGFDNGIRLKDILQDSADEKYYISQDKAEKLIAKIAEKDISNTVRVGWRGSVDGHSWDMVAVETPPILEISKNELKVVGNLSNTGHHGVDVYLEDGISPTLKARDYKDPIRVMQRTKVIIKEQPEQLGIR